MKLFLFDVDATLILTGGAGIRALNRSFHKLFQIETAMEGIAPHGRTDPAIIREMIHLRLGQTDPAMSMIATIGATYLEFLREEVEKSEHYCVLPGILDILEDLQRREDVALGLATGNFEQGARIKLDRGNLNRFFPFGGYGSDCEIRTDLVLRAAERASAHTSRRIDEADVFVIGDTPKDIEAAQAAGFRSVGVATGQYSVDQLKEAGADFALSNFQEHRDYFLRSTFME